MCGGLTKKIFTRSNFANRYARDAQPVDGPLAINRVQIEQGLRRMLPACTIAGIDYRHGRNSCRAARASCLVMPDYNRIAVCSDDANRIFNLLAIDLRREGPRVFGR